jgi:hypothetical protein
VDIDQRMSLRRGVMKRESSLFSVQVARTGESGAELGLAGLRRGKLLTW